MKIELTCFLVFFSAQRSQIQLNNRRMTPPPAAGAAIVSLISDTMTVYVPVSRLLYYGPTPDDCQ